MQAIQKEGVERSNGVLHEQNALKRLRELEERARPSPASAPPGPPPRAAWFRGPLWLLSAFRGVELVRHVGPGRPVEQRHVWEPNPFRPLL